MTTPPQPPERPPMTIRVYTVDRYGTVTSDRGTVVVPHDPDARPDPLGTRYPPCACPRCRLGDTG